MFARGIIVLLCVLGAKLMLVFDQPDCRRYRHNACPRIYKPVCGTDRVTYDNECLLCQARASDRRLLVLREGPCPRRGRERGGGHGRRD